MENILQDIRLNDEQLSNFLHNQKELPCKYSTTLKFNNKKKSIFSQVLWHDSCIQRVAIVRINRLHFT